MEAIIKSEPESLIFKVAEKLKESDNIYAPEWAAYVKTSHGKDRMPSQADWWYIRSASILRKVMLKGPIGTEKLRTLYGTRKNRGYKPEKFVKASGNITRKILQQLETEGLIKKDAKGVRKGRMVTPKGLALLNNAAKAGSKE